MQNIHKSILTKSRKFCSVPQCCNYCAKEISLHKFPQNPALKSKWKHSLKIGKSISKDMYVCSEHFLKEDFTPVTSDTQRKRLKKGVVPSQKLPVRKFDKSKVIASRSKRLWLERGSNNEAGVSGNKSNESKKLQHFEHIPLTENAVQGPQFSSITENSSVLCVSNVRSHTISQNFWDDKTTQTTFSVESFNFPDVLITEEKLLCFTGVTFAILNKCVQCAENVAQFNNIKVENLRNSIILVLCKLKTNLSFSCLSVLFGVSSSTCTRIFYKIVDLLSVALKPAIYWPQKEEILSNMPKCFENFKSTRVILDATEVKVQKLKCLKCRILSYSHYKCCHTMKFLIGITPSGLISYVSKGYGGRASDKAIFCREKLIDKLDAYDAIMVDKGILIEKECADNLIRLIRPPFLKNKKQFSKEEATLTANIAQARVHVERAIQRLKNFKILNSQIHWYIIPHIENIMTVIAAIVNVSSPILAEDKFRNNY